MRTSNIVQESQSSREVGENAIAMSIDEQSSVFLMDALGKLYSRPAQAALREYLSNAIDAHNAKGGTLPAIQVTLPISSKHSGKSMLSIRDFGKGMTESEFETILSRYGASTKRDSNKMIGGFGLGAKSGFAISDEFFMTSYQQGRGIKVRIFKDALNKGYIDVIDRFTTKEDDGMLVEVPIPQGNINEMSKKSLLTEFPFFMGYGSEEIDILPNEDHSSQSVKNDKVFTPLTMGGTTLGWLGKKSYPSKTYALIGRVAYLIDLKDFSSSSSKSVDKSVMDAISILKSFKRVKVLDIPIGAVDLPSSREEITYSERSIRTIGAILSNYALMLKQDIQKELNSKRTNLQALNFITELENSGYKAVNELTWKGQRLDDSFFKGSGMIITTFKTPDYGHNVSVRSEQGKNIRNFTILSELSGKSSYKNGVYRIVIDTTEEIQIARKLLTVENISSLLDLDTLRSSRDNHSAVFHIGLKDDSLSDWIFGAKEISLLDIRKTDQKFKDAKKEADKLAEKERIRKEQIRERNEKAKATRSKSMLSNFIINGGSAESIARNTVDNVFKDKKIKRFYWSEAEVTEFASVTKSDSRLIEGRTLFPFTAGHSENSFTVIRQLRNYSQPGNYLVKLRAFLRLFFEDGTKMILLDKARDLDAFKTDYPEVESGVLFVKREIDQQITDSGSEIMIAYNSYGSGRHEGRDEVRSLINFYDALNTEQIANLSDEIAESVARFRIVQKSKEALSSQMNEKFFLDVLTGFVTVETIEQNNYSIKDDVALLSKKYPLLLNGSFSYTEGVVNDLLEYVSMRAKRKVQL